MGIFALTQRFFQAEIRKLLLIIGLAVSIIIFFQCSALSYGKMFSSSPTNKSSIVKLVSNATTSNDSNMAELFVNVVANDANGFNPEEEARYRTNMPLSEVDQYHELTSKPRIAQGKSLMTGYITHTDDSSTQVKAAEIMHNHLGMVEKTKNSDMMINDPKTTTGYGVVPFISAIVHAEGLQNSNPSSGSSGSLLGANLSSPSNAKTSIQTHNKNFKPLQNASVISVSGMNSLLLQSIDSSHSLRPRRSSARDHELLSARQEIENAHVSRKVPVLHASVYQNISKFERSYKMMVQILKVYIYKEGAKPIFHQPKTRGIYASEGWFMKLMEGNKKFVVRDPRRAHLFYLPFSSNMLRSALNGPDFQHVEDLQKYLKDYVQLIAGKYSFWNRTGGADHFLVACHDWALKLTKHIRSCLRVICNSNAAKGFEIGKDITLPVTYIRSAEAPLENLGGKPPLERNILAFFAGGMHGYLRPILLQYWQNKMSDMKIFGPMPRDVEGKKKYREHMKSSKYCICARGYEVHTPRVVESIHYECVPVIIADNYVPPFFEVLNWETFAVFVQEKDIPDLRNILLSIPEEKYLEMHARVKLVQQHFLWHKKPVKYDLFHMILHSAWYSRVLHIKTG
ncbi:probable glycosyltransferase At3g07620 [Hibiscus syriacus]|nr:probable glycosyltransferase At3g07620 [Hibiscus syriacus]